jgi:DNA-binding FadR family transcriptional regulator
MKSGSQPLSSGQDSASPLPSRPDQLFQAISDDIAKGVYPPGSQLPTEAELCVHYKVSRTVLREAVARLKADGVVDARQGRGTFVLERSLRTPFRFDASAVITQEGIRKLAEFRLGVEGTAAALAAERRSSRQLALLKKYLEEMEKAVKDGSGGSEADLAFHQTIAEATGNDFYRTFMEYLRQFYAVAIDRARANSARQPGLSEQAHEEHVAIYCAIADKNSLHAEEAVKLHIRNASTRLSAQRASDMKPKSYPSKRTAK